MYNINQRYNVSESSQGTLDPYQKLKFIEVIQTTVNGLAPRCRINAMVFSFYPRAIRIWNMIPPKITR